MLCSTINEFNKHLSNLLQQLIKKDYHHVTLKEQIDKLRLEDRRLLLNKISQEVRPIIPISIKYNGTLLNIKAIVWHLLQVNPEFKEIFQSSLLIVFHKNINLKQIIGSNTTEHNKKVIKFINKLNGKCSSCSATTRTLCCKQVAFTASSR